LEIIATAKLVYWDGDSVTGGWERLELVVKFKENGKLFKRKLTKKLVSTFQVDNAHISWNPLNSYGEYFAECEKYLNDTYLIKKAAEKMIKDYFKGKTNKDLKDSRSKNISNRVSKLGEIEVKVKID
jgi:hypothetical protein